MDEGLVSVSEGRGHAVELRKEAYTMALYVSTPCSSCRRL
jgi:hypothetical protein